MPNSIEINCVLHVTSVISMMHRNCSKSYANYALAAYEGSIQEGCLIFLEYQVSHVFSFFVFAQENVII